jgi:hypothetical protein
MSAQEKERMFETGLQKIQGASFSCTVPMQVFFARSLMCVCVCVCACAYRIPQAKSHGDLLI